MSCNLSAGEIFQGAEESSKSDMDSVKCSKSNAGFAPDASLIQKPAENSLNSTPFCFLNIYKPKGITSFDVIYKLRKRFGIKKIGHSGTLDPLADGVMQVAIGNATRLLDYLGSDKTYCARVKFGWFSTTGDAEGEIYPADVPKFTKKELFETLNSMTGEIEQVPPLYSAIKVGGKKLCDLARKNAAKNIEIPKRIVKIYEVKLLSCQPKTADKNSSKLQTLENFTISDTFPLAGDGLLKNDHPVKNSCPLKDGSLLKDTCLLENIAFPENEKQISEIEIEISCSKGTYIRTFAQDLAKKLGTGAYLTALTRTKAGNFEIKKSVKIEDASLEYDGILPHLALENETYCLNEEEYKLVLNGASFMPVPEKLPSVYKNSPDLTFGKGCQNVQNPSCYNVSAQEPCRYSQNKEASENSGFKSGANALSPKENPPLSLLYKNNLVSIAVLSDNRIVCKKVFK